LLLSWSHRALFSVRNIPIFAVVSAPGIGLAMRDWLQFASAHWPLHWAGKLAASLDELEMGLKVIAGHQKQRHWHLLPCLAVLALAFSFLYCGRARALRADFDQTRFPADAASFLSHDEPASSLRLYASWQWGGYLIYRLWPSVRVRRRQDRFLWSSIRGRRTARMGGPSGSGRDLRKVSGERCSGSSGFSPRYGAARKSRLEARLFGPSCPHVCEDRKTTNQGCSIPRGCSGTV